MVINMLHKGRYYDLTQYSHHDVFKYSNCKYVAPLGSNVAADTEFDINPMVEDVVVMLHDKRQDLELLTMQANNVSQFHIFSDREYLGSLNTTYRGNSRVLEVRNDRIQSKLDRGTSRKSIDPTKIFRIINKEFRADTPIEVSEKIKDRCNSRIQTSLLSYRQSFGQSKSHMFDKLFEVMKDDLPKYVEMAWGTSNPDENDDVKHFWNNYEMAGIAYDVYNAVDNGDSQLVVIQNNEYYVSDGLYRHGRTSEYVKYTQDEVPEHIRRSVGMLKLLEPENYLKDVGFRASKHGFLILKESENE